ARDDERVVLCLLALAELGDAELLERADPIRAAAIGSLEVRDRLVAAAARAADHLDDERVGDETVEDAQAEVGITRKLFLPADARVAVRRADRLELPGFDVP